MYNEREKIYIAHRGHKEIFMGSDPSSAQSLHRKLILPNICIAVVALVAALSLFFGAWISVTVTVDETFVSELANEMGADESGADPEQIRFLFKGVQADITVSLEPSKMLKAGFAESTEGVREFLEEALGDAIESVSGLAEQMLPSMMAILAANALSDAGAGTIDYTQTDTAALAQTIEQLNAQQPDAAKQTFLSACDSYASAQLGAALTQEQRDTIAARFDEIVDVMKDENGTIAAENLLGAADGSSSVEIPDADALLGEIPAETQQLIQKICKIVGIAAYVLAGLWLLLAAFAVLHILLPNKKVAMWYVKATGFIPFLLCWLLPRLALKLMSSAATDVSIPAMAFGGITLVSFICLIVLWIISVFWCHPIKKRIRALN